MTSSIYTKLDVKYNSKPTSILSPPDPNIPIVSLYINDFFCMHELILIYNPCDESRNMYAIFQHNGIKSTVDINSLIYQKI